MSANPWDVLLECLDSRVDGGFESIFVYRELGCLKTPEFVKKIKDIFLEAASINNDKAALSALKILRRVLELSNGEEREDLLKTIQDFYWQMSYGRESVQEFLPVMENSKEFIIQAVIWEWEMVNSHNPKALSEHGKKLFRFIAECYVCLPENSGKIIKRLGENSFRHRTRNIFEKNQETIEKILRDAIKTISPENLELWLKEKWMPNGFAKLLGIAWARNGGYIKLMK